MRRVGGAVAAAATVVVLLAGCGSQAVTPTATPTVTVAPSTAPVAPTATATATATAAPSASPTAAASTAPAATATAAADGGTPADQCPDDAIGVTVVPAADGGGAGSEEYQVLFTNTGGSTCVLRGTPGVSVVGSGGAQLGPAADRVQTGVRSLRLAVGETVAAPLRVVNIGTSGGPLDGCRVVRGEGYRVYPPHSTRAIVYDDATATACADGPVFMTVSPVVRFSG